MFRLVASPGRQSYGVTLCELWQQCQEAGIERPQDKPPAASSITDARNKLDETVFKDVHREILNHANDDPRWKGHRIFAVDGSKFNLPRPLKASGWRCPNDNAHYPQGLVSVLYRLHSRIPVDFDLFKHENERAAALDHLEHVEPGDVIVYDRGYWSFDMARAHLYKDLNFVFRIKRNANTAFDHFIASDQTDQILLLDPPQDAAHRKTPPMRVRLVKYTIQDTEFRLATSLIDRDRYRIPVLADLYHQRWSIEEGYKSAKGLIEGFHAQSERGVRQELYATFILFTLARMFANRCDHDLNEGETDDLPAMRSNFKNGLRLVGREIETLFLHHSQMVRDSIGKIMSGLSACIQRERPGRSYTRESKKPRSKWTAR